jgi:hypothetical protein
MLPEAVCDGLVTFENRDIKGKIERNGTEAHAIAIVRPVSASGASAA